MKTSFNCPTDFWQKRVQGNPVFINSEKSKRVPRQKFGEKSKQVHQNLTFLPSLNLTGPSIIGIKSHILFNFTCSCRNQNKVGRAPRICFHAKSPCGNTVCTVPPSGISWKRGGGMKSDRYATTRLCVLCPFIKTEPFLKVCFSLSKWLIFK